MFKPIQYAQDYCMSSDRVDNMWIERLTEEYPSIVKKYNTDLDRLLSLREKYSNKKFLKKLDKEIDKEFKKLLTER